MLTKQAPTTGESESNSAVVLSWRPVDGVAMYGVCIVRTPANTCDNGWWPVFASSVQVHGLFPGTYSWQVVAITAQGTVQADNGAWWSFDVAGVLRHRPVPAGGGGGTPAKAKPRGGR